MIHKRVKIPFYFHVNPLCSAYIADKTLLSLTILPQNVYRSWNPGLFYFIMMEQLSLAVTIHFPQWV